MTTKKEQTNIMGLQANKLRIRTFVIRILIATVMVCGSFCIFEETAATHIDTSPIGEEITYSVEDYLTDSKVYNYYGDQLKAPERAFYDKLLEHSIKIMKTGKTEEITETFPIEDAEYKNMNAEEKKILCLQYMNRAYKAFAADYPVFDVVTYNGQYGVGDHSYWVSVDLTEKYKGAWEDGRQVINRVPYIAGAIDATHGKNPTEYERLEQICKHICKEVTYSFKTDKISKNEQYGRDPAVNSATGAMLDKYNHRAVCEGYAQYVKILCDYYGIKCAYLSSPYNAEGENMHAWNAVYIPNGGWYQIDTTWMDSAGIFGGISWKYFVVGYMSGKQHIADGKLTTAFIEEPFELPPFEDDIYKPLSHFPFRTGTVSDIIVAVAWLTPVAVVILVIILLVERRREAEEKFFGDEDDDKKQTEEKSEDDEADEENEQFGDLEVFNEMYLDEFEEPYEGEDPWERPIQ